MVRFAAVYGLLLSEASDTAKLPGYRMEFASGHPSPYAYAFATAVPAPGEEMEVGLVSLKIGEIDRFDAIEGVDPVSPERGFYRREAVTLGGSVAWLYLMNDARLRLPDEGLVRTMTHHYDRLGMDLTQIAKAIERAGAAELERHAKVG